jgi:hypothetical protein
MSDNNLCYKLILAVIIILILICMLKYWLNPIIEGFISHNGPDLAVANPIVNYYYQRPTIGAPNMISYVRGGLY